MNARTQTLIALLIAIVLTALTASLLLSGYVSAAIWMYGPYYLLSLLIPQSMDRLPTLVVVVAAYYFSASLIAFKFFSRRTLVLVAGSVVLLNCLGLIVFNLVSRMS